jgi:hypothetical protein
MGKKLLVTMGWEAGWAPEMDWMLWRIEKSLYHPKDQTPTV